MESETEPSTRAAAPGDWLEGLALRTVNAIPPASGAVVMGTGIVSIALKLDGVALLSDVLLLVGGVIWLALFWLLPARAIVGIQRFEDDLGHPTSLTCVAGTGVLGTRLTLLGWGPLAAVLLVIAVVLWLMLVPGVFHHWRTPTSGASFIVTVATESLALLSAALSDITATSWLLYAALIPFVVGLVFYLVVLVRFEFRQLRVGVGDHWVTGGALAISTVTAGRIALAMHNTGTLSGLYGAFKTIALVLWILTMCWLPVLLIAELLYPRLRYGVRRWSTVFPVGMYAACSFVVGAVTATHGIIDFARIWVWVALAVWLVVFIAMVRRAPGLWTRKVTDTRSRGHAPER